MRWLAALLFVWPVLSVAEAAAPPPPPTVRVEVQMVEVPLGVGLPLVPRLRRAESFAQAAVDLRDLIASGQAKILGWPVVQAISGERAVAESIEEVRYETEFDPPQGGMGIGTPMAAQSRWVPRQKNFSVPTAFETRNCGSTLEVEAVVDPATGRIDLNLVPRWVHLDFMEPPRGGSGPTRATRGQYQPRFTHLSLATSFSLQSGGHALLCNFILRRPQPVMVLFLLHASARH